MKLFMEWLQEQDMSRRSFLRNAGATIGAGLTHQFAKADSKKNYRSVAGVVVTEVLGNGEAVHVVAPDIKGSPRRYIISVSDDSCTISLHGSSVPLTSKEVSPQLGRWCVIHGLTILAK